MYTNKEQIKRVLEIFYKNSVKGLSVSESLKIPLELAIIKTIKESYIYSHSAGLIYYYINEHYKRYSSE